MTRELKVYWDSQDGDNNGWAYRLTEDGADTDSGPIDNPGDLDDAIDEACHMLDIPATHDDFACSQAEGGYGVWTEDVICPGCGKVNEYAHDEGYVEGPREYHADCWTAKETAQ